MYDEVAGMFICRVFNLTAGFVNHRSFFELRHSGIPAVYLEKSGLFCYLDIL